ncbi:MAG: hypothetical protein J0L77_03455 [Alphaproteobacteria bacterium]|nr:hypothetical protein [Alphaproteobacteria bacterium]
MDLKSLDLTFLKKLADPKLSGDLNAFLEKLPHNAGQTVLLAAGIAWAMAGALGLFTTIQVKQMTELRAKLKETQALKPTVPVIKDVAVDSAEVANFSKELKEIYKNLDITQSESSITITSNSTASFGQFREAVGHVQNGGVGWRVTLDKLCVGRECDNNQKLGAVLRVNKVSVESPG